jgi:diguanylate cyclase (GGDEF)-like protein/PAS domain S-box-containing protein
MKRDVQTGIIIIDEIKQTIFSLNHYIYSLTDFTLEEIQDQLINVVFSEEKESLIRKDGSLVPVFFEKSRIFVHKKSYTMYIIWNEEYEIQHHPIYKTITENSYDLVQILRKDLTTTFISPSHENTFDTPTFRLENKFFLDFVFEDDKKAVQKKLINASIQQRIKKLKFKLLINNELVNVEAKFSPVLFNDKDTEYIVVTMRKLSLKNDELEGFIKTEQMFDSIFSNNPDSVFSLDLDFCFNKVNNSFLKNIAMESEKILKEQIKGIPFTSFIHPDDFIEIYRNLDLVRKGKEIDLTTKMLKNDGTTFHIKISLFPNKIKEEVVGIFGIIKDINQLVEQREENRRLAFNDGLTGLPNRRSFQADLEERIVLAKENKTKKIKDRFAIFFFDLDGFKKINDNLGHKAGDDLLIAVARRVEEDLPGNCKLFRVSGDEFTIIVEKFDEKKDLYRIARGILKSFSKNFSLEVQEVLMTSSIGISIYPDHSTNLEELIKYADSAMYYSKNKGKNYFSFFKNSMTIESVDHFYINQFLPKALENNEFQLFFQPIIDAKTDEIVFSESLIRWNHQTEGFIPPTSFIPLAEVSGFIFKLGDWIIEEAFKNLHKWKNENYELTPISINISGKQFERNSVSDMIEKMSKKYDIEPSYIIIEITETVAMEGKSFVLEEIKKLKKIGCKISIDDFGSGYSSLIYLKNFPVDSIKMDKEFISDLINEKNQRKIVQTIIDLGHILNLYVVAEGVESEEEKKILNELNVDYIQGYLFSKPLNSSDYKRSFLNKLE